MSASPLVELVDVSFRADGAKLLDRISWQLWPHTHWAVLGPNGAGKTTLIRILGGLMWPNAGGEVLRGGARLANLHNMRRGIGWVNWQLGRRVPARERVDSLVESGRYAELGLRPPIKTEAGLTCRRDAAVLMEQLGFAHLSSRRFVTLSQGEQQIVLLARAMMAEPCLIILDEPCAGLDPHARERFLAALSAVIQDRPRSPSIVLVTHHLEDVIPAVHYLLAMQNGRVFGEGSPAELISEEWIQRLYGTRPRTINRAGGRYWPVWC